MTTQSLRHRLRSFGHRLSPAALGCNPQAPDQGLTLIECLVAIVMVALVASAIAPALVISVATRVQSQRTEQALALAQAEIDSVRVLVERGGYTAANLPASVPTLSDQNVKTALGPDLSVTVPTNPAYARPVDINGDGQTDFWVQRYRAKGQVVGGTPVAFAMGVRVYDGNVTGAGNLSTEQASLVMTSSDGGRSKRPLATLYTTVAASNTGQAMCSLITYLNSTSSTNNALPATCAATP